MAGKGGGAWKVAYADFVTAMMAFFLVMWITAQNKSVKESVAQYFQNPLGTVPEARATSVHGIEGASADAPLTGEQAGPYGSDSKEIGSEPLAEGGGKEGPGGVEGIPPRPLLHIFEQLDKTRGVGTMVVFADQSAELTQQAKLQLAALLPDLLGKPHKIEVRGHATRNPLPAGSKYSGPWDISFARAIATMDYLVSRGIEADRIRLSQDGAFEPYADDGNELNDTRNARVEVFALGEFTHRFKQTVEERAGGYVPAKEKPVAAAKDAGHGKDGAHGKDAGHGGGGHGGEAAHGSGASKGAGAAHGKKDDHATAGAHAAPAAKGGHGH